MPVSLINWTLNVIDPHADTFMPPADMRYKINTLSALPPLPHAAQQVFALSADPYADAAGLAAVVEQDPLLTAQIIRWASSPYYGYRGKIVSVKDAISRVLGFDMVFNLALGLAVLAPLKFPKNGQIGAKMFWTHAIAGAEVMSALNAQLPRALQSSSQEIFLAALLHNLGFPLLADQFSEEFGYLNTLIAGNSTLPVINLENFALGVNHAMLGTWLMSNWAMPKPIVDVVYHHHNPYYRGEHYSLNLLTFLSDCLLGALGIGDGCNQACPDEVFDSLRLPPVKADKVMEKLTARIEKISVAAAELIEG